MTHTYEKINTTGLHAGESESQLEYIAVLDEEF
jgi:hypothetical protein